jgi:MFS family permease
MNLLELFVISPIGFIAALGSGLINGTFYSLGNVFGAGVGFSDNRTAAFMAITILSGAAFQWPVGHLSDRYDRRWILFWICVISAVLAAIGFYLAREFENFLILLGVLYGAMSFAIYGLSVAHTNDLIEPSKVLETSGGLLLLYGIGATIGPTLAGGLMDYIGPEGLMLFFALVLGALSLAVWYFTRRQKRQSRAPAHRGDYVMMEASSPAVLQMDPRGMAVVGLDGQLGGTVTDIWVDRAERIIRYLEVAIDGVAGQHVLVPMAMSTIERRRNRVVCDALKAEQFAGAPLAPTTGTITLYEEERAQAYFGGGYLYATAARQEPLI